jgi:hypothetical protein
MSAQVQEIVTLIICAAAAFAVGKRMWRQLAAIFVRSKSSTADSEASACSGCDSCGLHKAAAPQIITLSTLAPKRKSIKTDA